MKKILLLITLVSFMTISCDRTMEDINTNPDATEVVPARFLATGAILNITSNSNGKNFIQDSYLMKSLVLTELAEGTAYNSIGSFGMDYAWLTDMNKMIEMAHKASMSEAQINSYEALANFVKAWVFFNHTIRLGDVPCSESLQGESAGIFRPKYDTQEAVFEQIIMLLDKSSELFGKGDTFEGDPIYNGDAKKWAKTTNCFMLRVLSELMTKKTAAGSINVKTKFEEYANKDLYSSYAEDFQRLYSNKAGQYYPFYRTVNNYNQYMYLQEFFVDMMKKYNDYRLFFYAEPAGKAIEGGILETSFDAYKGVDGTTTFGTVQGACNSGNISPINLRYWSEPDSEPVKKLSYSEVQFILAEAADKGWKTPKSAKEHYNAGVKAALEFTAKCTKADYRHGRVIDAAYVSEYINEYASWDKATNKLELIMEQKYISCFMQSAWNTYFDYRRTGFPKIPINKATSQNQEAPDKLPVRWTYPSGEGTNNKDNLAEAIQRQFGGTSQTMNSVIWLLK